AGPVAHARSARTRIKPESQIHRPAHSRTGRPRRPTRKSPGLRLRPPDRHRKALPSIAAFAGHSPGPDLSTGNRWLTLLDEHDSNSILAFFASWIAVNHSAAQRQRARPILVPRSLDHDA